MLNFASAHKKIPDTNAVNYLFRWKVTWQFQQLWKSDYLSCVILILPLNVQFVRTEKYIRLGKTLQEKLGAQLIITTTQASIPKGTIQNNQKYGMPKLIQLLDIASVKTDSILKFKHVVIFYFLSNQTQLHMQLCYLKDINSLIIQLTNLIQLTLN